jgi:transposase
MGTTHAHRRPPKATVALLDQFGWDIITHPPYSPDLAPCEYHLFPKLKEHLAGRRFSDDDASTTWRRVGMTWAYKNSLCAYKNASTEMAIM